MNSIRQFDALLKLFGLMLLSIFAIYFLLGDKQDLEALNDPIFRTKAAIILTAAFLVTSFLYFKYFHASIRKTPPQAVNITGLLFLTVPLGAVYFLFDKLLIVDGWFIYRITFYAAALTYIAATGMILLIPRFFEWYVFRGEKLDELSQFAGLKANASMKILFMLILLFYRLAIGLFELRVEAATALEEILGAFIIANYFVEPFLVRYFISRGEN